RVGPLGRRRVVRQRLWRRRGWQVGHVRGGQHRDHPGRLKRRGGVNASYQGVRDRRPNERGPHRPSEIGFAQVVDVDAARGEKPRILRTDDPRAENAHLSSAYTAFPANLHLTGSAILAWLTQSHAPRFAVNPKVEGPHKQMITVVTV